ncbi:PhzF family phenazine biosynthesis protein [Qaidamihabitans albus]|uniref:PhzF family phenazine biosynthesis protein n=1 Tax=Qaidamihabitans albus TaxID=2795733 RepID=UPI0018F15EB7|nr:PhzF family phenazine biosynthesis protein [Qaidamihabitans albus]
MRLYTVDAFTGEAFRGNPAGVVLLDAPASPRWMQDVAAELGHADTAFVVTTAEPKPLRWFTPVAEVNLCGHATLAATHVLGGTQVFDTRSGELRCTADGDRVWMDLPADVPVPLAGDEPGLDVLPPALPGVTIEELARTSDDVLVRAADAAQVRAVEPDLTVIAGLPAPCGAVVTAESDRDGTDFVSRVFAPAVGIPEDPVTGSAHCALAPYWAARLGRIELTGEQASRRGGIVGMQLRGGRVTLSGQAVTVTRGELLV